MRHRVIVISMLAAALLAAGSASQARAKARTSYAPSSAVPPYSSLIPTGSCTASGGATCSGSSAGTDPSTGQITAVAKIAADPTSSSASGTSTQQGTLTTTLGLTTSEPAATLAVTFTLTDLFSNFGAGQSYIDVRAYGLGCGGNCYATHRFQFCVGCDAGSNNDLNTPKTLYLTVTNAKGGLVPAQNFDVTVTPAASATVSTGNTSQANVGLVIKEVALR